MKALILTLAAAAVLTLGACNTVEGIGEDISAASRTVKNSL